MKLRYVFPLMLAAAVGGAALAYSRFSVEDVTSVVEESLSNLFENKREQAQRKTRNDYLRLQSRYRSIASALSAACPSSESLPGSEMFQGWLKEIEKAWVEENVHLRGNKDVSRTGPILRIKTKERDFEILDVGYLCDSPDIRLHKYKGMLSKADWHVVEMTFYEGASWTLLISAETGEAIDTFGLITESPSGQRLVSYFSEEAAGGGYEIYRIEGHRLVREFRQYVEEPNVTHPDSHLLEVIGWIDDETILVLMNRNRQAQFSYHDGRWQFQYLDP